MGDDAVRGVAPAALPDDIAKVNGTASASAAAAILAARALDGRDGTVTYVPGSGPGVGAPTPPAPSLRRRQRLGSSSRLP
jgi:hypothetical protein